MGRLRVYEENKIISLDKYRKKHRNKYIPLNSNHITLDQIQALDVNEAVQAILEAVLEGGGSVVPETIPAIERIVEGVAAKAEAKIKRRLDNNDTPEIAEWREKCPELFDYPNNKTDVGATTAWDFLTTVYKKEKHGVFYLATLRKINRRLYGAIREQNQKEQLLITRSERIKNEVRVFESEGADYSTLDQEEADRMIVRRSRAKTR